MDTDEVLVIQNRVLVLTGRINEFDGKILTLVSSILTEVVLDSRVVGIDKVAVDVLYRQRAFACGDVVVVVSWVSLGSIICRIE